jgi:hypothetical protein
MRYGCLALPWGSNPVTNPFLASDTFGVVTDGAGFSRCEKARLIAAFPAVKDKLRVCWAGPLKGQTGENCGICEKCLRTKMNFLSNGDVPGLSLSQAHTLLDIVFINGRNDVQIAYLKDILHTARRNGVKGAWIATLHAGILFSRIAHLVALAWWRCPQRKQRAAAE